jgi:sulfotransferase
VFDTNRMWTARLGALAALHPEARIICCVRHVPWIIDSVERLVRANPLELSGMFGFDAAGTVYSRAEALGGAAGLLGLAWNALREACHGPEAGRMLLLTYETLTTDPLAALRAIYDFTGLPGFAHDPERVGFDAATAAAAREFDARLGMPGLHRLGARVHAEARASLLPPELFARYEGASFWRDPACGLPAGLRIV